MICLKHTITKSCILTGLIFLCINSYLFINLYPSVSSLGTMSSIKQVINDAVEKGKEVYEKGM